MTFTAPETVQILKLCSKYVHFTAKSPSTFRAFLTLICALWALAGSGCWRCANFGAIGGLWGENGLFMGRGSHSEACEHSRFTAAAVRGSGILSAKVGSPHMSFDLAYNLNCTRRNCKTPVPINPKIRLATVTSIK